jgi:photosystem II stability/assembly factor-like uncharacterized protein
MPTSGSTRSAKTGSQATRRRAPSRLWVGLGFLALIGLILGGWWLARRGDGSTSNAQAISRLSTEDFHSLAFSPREAETVFFGHHGGLLVSRDGGRSWTPTALQNADAMALAIPIADPSVIYAAGHNVFYKSLDGGATWQLVPTNLPGLDIHGFAVDPANADQVYAHVVGYGVFGSQDGGRTWSLRSGHLLNSTFSLAVGEAPERLYAAAGQAGLLRSDDGGQTWAPVKTLPDEGAITVAYDRGSGRLYVSTLGSAAGLYVSQDGEATWQRLGPPGTYLAVAINPLDPKRLLVVDQGGWVYASRDGGATWPGD